MDKCLKLNELEKVCMDYGLTEFLKRTIASYEKSCGGFYYVRKIESKCILLNVRGKSAHHVSSSVITRMAFLHSGKFLKYRDYTIFVFNFVVYKPQFGLSDIPILGGLSTFVMDKVCLLKGLKDVSQTPEFSAYVIDIATIMADLNGFKSVTTFFSIIMRVYSLILRWSGFRSVHRYNPETITITDIALGFVAYGVPEWILKKVRDFSTLVNARVQFGSLFMKGTRYLLSIIKDLLLFFGEKFNIVTFVNIASFLSKEFGWITHQDQLDEMNAIYAEYVRRPQIILELPYRQRVMALDDQIGYTVELEAYLEIPEMRHQKALYHSFKSNIVKFAKHFDTTTRQEPVCIVFEGIPKSRKSVMMTTYADYLRHKNRAVYTHSVPGVTEGKDFYDNYENQSVFMMDDVGQKSLSQWRHIINFVAPIKMPLECAVAEKKNTKFFNSELILASTNALTGINTFTSADCIANRGALFRRIHVFKFNSSTQYNLEYLKYDGDAGVWKNEFLDHMSDCVEPVTFKGSFDTRADMLKLIAWVHRIVTHAERKNREFAVAGELSRDDLTAIDNLAYPGEGEFADALEEFEMREPFGDFLPESYFTDMIEESTSQLLAVKNYLVSRIASWTTSVVESLSTVGTGEMCYMALMALGVGLGAYRLFFRNDEVVGDELGLGKLATQYRYESDDISDHIASMRDNCFFATVESEIEGVQKKVITQCIMSGNYVLMNDHAVGSNPILNIYKDYNAYNHKHLMFNNLPVKIVERLLTEDLVILEVERFPISPMKRLKWAADDTSMDYFKANKMFCINSDLCKPVVNRANATVSSSLITYERGTVYSIPPGGAIEYDITCPGLCGSLLVTDGGIPLGHHVAGSSDGKGVIKLWSQDTRRKLKGLFSRNEAPYSPVHKESVEDFSGLRFRQTDLKTSRVPSKSGFVPTPLNGIRESEEFDKIMEDLEKNPIVSPPDRKGPVNLRAFGGKTLEKMAAKSYKPIPSISFKEVEFAKECLRSMMCDFSPITDQETAFGNEDLTELNKKSVNGYGYEKEKDKYFNYEEKVINPEFLERVRKFEDSVLDGSVKVEDLLCVESLKDELRPEGKVNKPRAFRILPLHHTFLVKKYLGQLFVFIKNNMWKNGVAIGFNPYKDFDKLYKVLKSKYGFFDGDFGKYDGSAPSQLQDAIRDVVMEFFSGSDRERAVLLALLDSMIRSWVLTKEKLYLTTHSLPSGCWVTALFNSFLNRMLTAICLYRNKPNATVLEWKTISDFVLGDDKLVGVPKSLSKYVNALTMKEVAESLGMEYTDARKGEITEPFKKLEECQFLKRSFLYHPELNKYVGALDVNTIIETLRFFDCGKVYEEAMSGKMTMVQFELFLYGNMGGSLLSLIKRRARESGVEFRSFSYSEIAECMLDQDTYSFIMQEVNKYNSLAM